VLGTGVSFLTLKLGTAVLGWLTLPFVYLFAREFGGRRVALAAVFLAGIAFWPNLLGRTGLRFTLYPFFAAPALFFLVRGLREQRRNDFLLAGLCTGLSLYGYSPARILPFVLIGGVLVYLTHSVARGRRMQILFWLATAGVIALSSRAAGPCRVDLSRSVLVAVADTLDLGRAPPAGLGAGHPRDECLERPEDVQLGQR
jgi:asparagine N-glycosylation enzyme membrane subunit Stt3